MGLLDFLHQIADDLLARVKMIQNRQVGWLTIDRKTGQLIREQQPLWKKVKLLLLFNPLTEWLDTTHLMRLYMHREAVKEGRDEATPTSRKRIAAFIDFYHIDMTQFTPSDITQYANFEDFFVRAHTPAARPLFEPDNPRAAVVVADSRVVTYESVAESKRLWIKGVDFSITNLVMDRQLGREFDGSPVASFRLSPQDYHRFHSPVTGTVRLFRSMPGDYYEVDPIALRSGVDILTRNARDYVVVESEEFGAVLFVAIGAAQVGTVQFHERFQQPGARVQKGDELGHFQFGGSSIIVAFQPGRIVFDADLLRASKHAITTDVEVGMSLGRAVDKV
ncbi:putative phosphatidylserine decarboxylase [Aspergillus saccharolyticus JOP 1030-1]|uniref:phosphatidylserine decarboxylase n=1 Tax=Aspergillus saccharolyticus JOP 1030-1 TaxID=1450539 RepID=A0A318ZGV6_9EURO|nr:phosphatidylserine decarboxylase [Aspergillus saccharolyticus JOP 1030-1]PYH42900.1 phosphatidylserine decarboxylase [Aspergillus saccharolyticus JOP 1030-1]